MVEKLKQYGFPAAFAVAFAVAGSLPYAYGYLHAGDTTQFTGFVGRGVFGPNGYMMLARQAQHGQRLFENLMTPENVPRAFFNLEWWLFGRMAAWTGLSLVAMHHVWRMAIVALIAAAVWYLARSSLESRFQQRFAFALIFLGSGFGWIFYVASKIILYVVPSAQAMAVNDFNAGFWMRGLLFPLPLDIKGVSLPAYMINQPHFVLATACAVLAFAFLIAGENSGKVRYFILSGLMAFLHAAVRPYNIPETLLIYILFPVLLSFRDGQIDRARIGKYALAAVFLLPAVVYYAWIAKAHVLGGSKGPNWTPGHFVDDVLWLGLPCLLMCLWIAGVGAIRTAKPSTILLGLWLAIAFVLEQSHNYYNTGQEASFPSYMIVPAILATAGPFRAIYHFVRDNAFLQRALNWEPATPRFKRIAAACVVAACMPSFILAYAMMFTSLRDRPAPYYISNDVAAGIAWLEENAATHDTVLANFETSQLVPRMAGIKTFQGHYMITPDAPAKRTQAERFAGQPGDDAFKHALVKDNNIRYVLFGPSEGNGAETIPWLKTCFTQGPVRIFKVTD